MAVDYSVVLVNTNAVAFPGTKSVNSSGPSTTDGTEYVKVLIDDVIGFNQALLNYTGGTPSGSADEDGASQYLDSVVKIVSNVDTTAVTGSYTVETWNKKGVLVCNAGVGTITLAAGTGTDQSNRILIYNQSGGNISLNTGAVTETIADGKAIEYIYDGSANFVRTAPDAVTPNGYKAGLNMQLSGGNNLEIRPGIMQYFDANGVSKLKEISSITTVTNETTVSNNFLYFVYYDSATDQFKVDNSIRTTIPVGGPAIQTAYTAILNTGDANVNFDKVKNYYETGTGFRIIGFVTKLVATWDLINSCDFWTGADCSGQNDLGWFRRNNNVQIVRKRDSVVFTTTLGTGRAALPYYAQQIYNLPVAYVAPVVATDIFFTGSFSHNIGFPLMAVLDNSSLTQVRMRAYSEVNSDTGKFNYYEEGPFVF